MKKMLVMETKGFAGSEVVSEEEEYYFFIFCFYFFVI